MKKILSIFLLNCLIIIIGCENDSNPNLSSSKYLNKKIENVNYSSIPDSIINLYNFYSGILAVREMANDPKLNESTIEIPIELKNLFFNALCQVYNSTNLPARNLVVNVYKIGVFPTPSTQDFYIEVDTNEIWVKTLIINRVQSGNSSIDNLISQYSLNFIRYYNFNNFQGILFSSSRQLNLNPLLNILKSINGVKSAYTDGVFGDGSNITAEIFTDFIELVYSYGYGDCPSGCIHKHYWKFRVYYDGVVEFVNEWGDPIN